jgi:hypothetical protein
LAIRDISFLWVTNLIVRAVPVAERLPKWIAEYLRFLALIRYLRKIMLAARLEVGRIQISKGCESFQTRR